MDQCSPLSPKKHSRDGHESKGNLQHGLWINRGLVSQQFHCIKKCTLNAALSKKASDEIHLGVTLICPLLTT